MPSNESRRTGELTLARRWVVPMLLGVAVVLSACRTVASPELERLMAPTALPEQVVAEAPVLEAAALEQAIHDHVNAVRAVHDLPPLRWSDELAQVTRDHSRDMARQGYFAHVNLAGDDPTARATRAGVASVSAELPGIGENLFLTHRYAEYIVERQRETVRYVVDWKQPEELARQTVAAWLESPAHRANLLYDRYAAHAVGVELGPNQTVFVTQNLSCGRLLVTHATRAR